ncbi:Na+/H+ antiporter subunit E [bacterium]|nr:Na+/H+ antiporter subunit E [bacterium]
MRYFFMFIVLYIIWLMVTCNMEVANFYAGAIVALIVTALFGKEFPYHPKHTFQIKRYFAFIKFLGVFFVQVVHANFIMAYRVLSPNLPIKPGIVEIPLYLKSPLGRVILANAITLAPGTFTMDITSDTLILHWIYVQTEDPHKAEEIICGRLQRILKEVFE